MLKQKIVPNMKTKPSNQYKIKILQKVAEKILAENGFRLVETGTKHQIYENPECSSSVMLSSCEKSITITNRCRGNIPFFGYLIRGLIKDNRFIFNNDCTLLLHGNLALTIDALWESVSHYLSHEETAEIFQFDRPAKIASVKILREMDSEERELAPPTNPIETAEFI